MRQRSARSALLLTVSFAARHMCLLLLQVHLYTDLTLLYAVAVLGSLLL